MKHLSPAAQVYLLGLMLIMIGLGFLNYKHTRLGLPVMPGAYQTVWTIEAKVTFNARNDAVEASLALPKPQSNIKVLDNTFSSSGYNFRVENIDGHERAIWQKMAANGPQSLYYKFNVYQDGRYVPLASNLLSQAVVKPDWAGSRFAALREAAHVLVTTSRQVTTDVPDFAGELLRQLQDSNNPDGVLVLSSLPGQSVAQVGLALLAQADVPAHLLRGIYLETDRSRLTAIELIELFDGRQWVVLQPIDGAIGLPNHFMIWQRGDRSLLDIQGGENSRVRFSVLANNVPVRQVALKRMEESGSAMIDFSIYSLPIEQQSIFKFILLVPIGALVVTLLRVLVGVRTAGTFMPVLLAIAFIQTTLLTGVFIFLVILVLGLWVRSYLNHLDLLLVSRIAAVVVVVVGVMMLISIVSYKIGYEQALTVTFFPMIILAWAIEHMSILWEDDGPMEVCIQTAGTLFVAVCCYLVMTNRYVEHWTFNFPEVLLVSLGLIVVAGHYTGYRLSELLRFKQMRNMS